MTKGKIKYKLNFNPATYNYKTKQYECKKAGTIYTTFKEARSKQWLCDKCGILFATLKELRIHKVEKHSY